MQVDEFIERWLGSGGSEMATAQSFAIELTELLGVPRPNVPEQIAAVREALTEMGEATPEQIARRFVRARVGTITPLLESLAALGQADKGEDGKFAA